MVYLKERVLLLGLELVGTEKTETAGGLLISKTVLRALEELEDVLDDDSLEVDLLLVVKILRLELNLSEKDRGVKVCTARISQRTRGAYLGHVDLGI